MSCPRCGGSMWVNGSYWQCSSCGWLVPYNGVVPDGMILLPLAAK